MATNPYLLARTNIDPADDPQRPNREWWEKLPMTYQAWENEDRSTTLDRVIATFLDGNPWLSRSRFGAFVGKRVLEIGCGAGPATCLFAQGGAEVRAIDLTEASVALTQKHAAGLGATVVRMDAEKLLFPEASFDHVFSWGVLHHSAHPERAFAEVARVLKPGGTALIMVYNRSSLRYWVKGLIWLLLRGRMLRGDSMESVQRFFTDGYYHRHYTPREFASALAPLRVTRMGVTHMGKKMLPAFPVVLDEALKRRFGWLLVAEIAKD